MLPGVRKEVEVDGRQVMLFWYRNQMYCIQSRSPAEGAFSEGFITAKFTQVGNVLLGLKVTSVCKRARWHPGRTARV